MKNKKLKNKKLVGIFASEKDANEVIKNLKKMGYINNEISVISKNSCMLDKINKKDVEFINVSGGEDSTSVQPKVLPTLATEESLDMGLIILRFGDMTIPGSIDRIARSLVNIGIDKKDADKYMGYIDRCDVMVAVEEKSKLEKNQVLKYYKDNNSLI